MKISKRLKQIEKIKELRDILRDETRTRLESCFERKKILEERSESLNMKWHQAMKNFRNRCSEGILSTDELLWMRKQINDIGEDMDRIAKEIDLTEEEVICIQEELMEKHKNAKIADVFLETAKKESKHEMIKKEQKEIDDLALFSFIK
jgi:flagellar export protein FliJ